MPQHCFPKKCPACGNDKVRVENGIFKCGNCPYKNDQSERLRVALAEIEALPTHRLCQSSEEEQLVDVLREKLDNGGRSG